LLKAIPSPDPTERWETRANVKITDRPLTHEGNKCVYIERCPQAMEICARQRPPDHVVEEGHVAACFLYQDYPTRQATASIA
jgi:ABC-type dipeptide/oligopeptide/nickel transport system ATPase component